MEDQSTNIHEEDAPRVNDIDSQALLSNKQDMEKKCVVKGLPKWMTQKKFEKMLKDLNIHFIKTKKIPSAAWGMIVLDVSFY